MNNKKYIGMDVHQATISVAVRDSRQWAADYGIDHRDESCHDSGRHP